MNNVNKHCPDTVVLKHDITVLNLDENILREKFGNMIVTDGVDSFTDTMVQVVKYLASCTYSIPAGCAFSYDPFFGIYVLDGDGIDDIVLDVEYMEPHFDSV